MLFAILFSISACSNSTTKLNTKANSQIYKAEELKEADQPNDKALIKQDMNVNLELAPDIKKIIDRGKLLVGLYSEDMPPFFMTDRNGELYGYDIYIAKNIAEHLNVGVEFDRSASTYQELFEKVAQGKVDIVISKFSATLERTKYVRFTKPYLEMRCALLVNRKYELAKDAEDYPIEVLKSDNIKIGVKSNTSYAAFAKELFPNASLVELPEWKQVVDLLAKGQISAAMYDELEVIKLVRQNPDISLYASIFLINLMQKNFLAEIQSWRLWERKDM